MDFVSEGQEMIIEEPQNISSLDEFRKCRKEIYEATSRKMLIVTDQEIKAHSAGRFIFFSKLRKPKDIPATRDGIRNILEARNMKDEFTMNLLLAVSELTTNVIKHAERGSITVVETKDEYTCLVQDRGPGFQIEDLKDKTLAAGYSTKDSLGMGFSIVLKLADQLLLANTDKGSIIAAKFLKDAEDKLFLEDPFKVAK